MKTALLFILLLTCFIWSAQKSNTTVYGQADPFVRTYVASQPTSSQHKSDQDSIPFPAWLHKLYPSVIKVNYGYYSMTQKLTYFKVLNDSITYCIYETDDGVCLRTNLATQKYQGEFEDKEIAYSCDQDQSMPGYRWTTFRIIPEHAILSTQYSAFIVDSLWSEESGIKDNRFFDDCPHNLDSNIYQFTVTATGEIERLAIIEN